MPGQALRLDRAAPVAAAVQAAVQAPVAAAVRVAVAVTVAAATSPLSCLRTRRPAVRTARCRPSRAQPWYRVPLPGRRSAWAAVLVARWPRRTPTGAQAAARPLLATTVGVA